MTTDRTGFVVFAGTDYLGLTDDERVIEAATRAARDYGMGTSSSRIGMGTIDLHLQLEARLARFMGTEAAFAYVSGWLGGITYFGIHAAADCEAFLDTNTHGSVRLGAAAYGLAVQTYGHRDADDVARRLGASTAEVKVVATDGLFGMRGDPAPLADLAAACREHGAVLLVDDAHGVGVLGETGRGTAQHLGLAPDDAIIVGSLSKAFGSGGGFVAGPRAVIDRVRRTPPAVGATPISPAMTAGALAALEIIENEPERRARAIENGDRLRAAAARLGLTTGGEGTPIVPMFFPDADTARRAARAFKEAGLLIPYFIYSSHNPPNRLRGIARATHTDDDLQRFEAALEAFLRSAP